MYSVGVGEDLTFDISLIRKYPVKVHAFDPTPRSIQWIKGISLPQALAFHDCGVAATDGVATFYPPTKDVAGSSYSMSPRPETVMNGVSLHVARVASIMTQLGHTELEVLKLDVQGAEYEILPDIIESQLRIRQIVVEFHHRFFPDGMSRTHRTLNRLRKYGYQVAYADPELEIVALVR